LVNISGNYGNKNMKLKIGDWVKIKTNNEIPEFKLVDLNISRNFINEYGGKSYKVIRILDSGSVQLNTGIIIVQRHINIILKKFRILEISNELFEL